MGADLTIIHNFADPSSLLHSCHSSCPPSSTSYSFSSSSSFTTNSPFHLSHRHTSVRPASREHVAGEVLPGERLPEEAAGSRWGEVLLQPMPDHHGPGGPGRGQHPGSRGVRPVRRGGQKQRRAQHHHLLLHRRRGIRLRRTVLRRVRVPRSQDGVCIPLQLCDRRRAAGFYHRLESLALLCHRQVWQYMIHSNYDTFHHRFILFSTLLMIEKNIKTFIKIRIH